MTAQSIVGWLHSAGRICERAKRSLPMNVGIAVLLTLLVPESHCSISAAQREREANPIVVTGRVVDAAGEPVDGAVVDIYKVDLHTNLDSTVTTNPDGGFEATIGVDRERLANVRVRARSDDGSQLGYFRFTWDGGKTISEGIVIRLETNKVARVKVFDAMGTPIPDAHVALQLDYPHTLSDGTTDQSGLASFRLPRSERIEAVVAWKDHAGLDYRSYSLSRDQKADVNAIAPEFPADGVEMLQLSGASPFTVSVVDDRQQPLKEIRPYPWLLKKDSEPDQLNLSYFNLAFSQETDATGKTTFNWIPAWQKSPITVWPHTTEFVHARGNYDPQTGSGLLEMQLDRLVPIRGRVVDADGRPVEGITVAGSGAGYNIDGSRASTSTDDQGRYELLVPPDQIYLVVVNDEQWAATPQDGFAVFKNTPVDDKDFTLRKATRVLGRLVEEQTEEPFPNERVIVYQYGRDLQSLDGIELANSENSRQHVCPMQFFNTMTDDQGRFEFALGDGNFDIRPPSQEKADKFEIAGQEELELLLTTKAQREVELLGLVFGDERNLPLAGVRVTGVPQNFRGRDWQATTGEDGKFKVKRYRQPTYVHAVSADKKLAAIDEVGPEKRIVVLQLRRVGSAKGRLLTSDLRGPLAGQKINYGVSVPDENDQTWSDRFGGTIVTEADGTFRLDGLVPGREYTLNLPSRQDGTIPTLRKLTVTPEESIDLGDLPAPKP